MKTRELVFVHGRLQGGKDPGTLKANWIDTLKKGLKKSQLDLPIPEDRIRFPYYGDTLDQLVAGVSESDVAKIVVRGPDGQPDLEQQAFIAAVLEEAARKVAAKQGLSDEQMEAEVLAMAAVRGGNVGVVERGPLNWEWVQSILSFIDQRVPGGSATSLALFTRDVYQYVTNRGLRKNINDGMCAAMTSGVESVVVGHSLGTVVSYWILRDDGGPRQWKVPLYVTVGSPLAVTKIREQLKPIRYPECAAHWFNAMDPDDVVSLYPLDSKHFNVSPAIENKTDVDNHTDNQHGIEGYLDDPVVASKIYDALVK